MANTNPQMTAIAEAESKDTTSSTSSQLPPSSSGRSGYIKRVKTRPSTVTRQWKEAAT